MMFARLDFSTFLICCSGDISEYESEEKPSVAICGGSICILTGLRKRSGFQTDGSTTDTMFFNVQYGRSCWTL